MDLTIDGQRIWAKPGQTLLELVRQLGFLTGKLSADPLAAKIAGQIDEFTRARLDSGFISLLNFRAICMQMWGR